MGLTKFEKLFISLRYYLLAAAKFDPSYKYALDALEFAKEIHVGTRKDGFTPEFQHQLEIAHFIRTLDIRFPAATIAVVLLHDVLEDYSNKPPFVTKEQIYARFGQQIGDACVLISKEYQGVKVPTQEYYDQMALCPICSIAKGGDRVHNQSSMANVFTKTKQLSYIDETVNYVLPMLKVARRIHFDQESAYENIKFVLQSQITFVHAYNKNEERNEKALNDLARTIT